MWYAVGDLEIVRVGETFILLINLAPKYWSEKRF